MIGDFTGEEIYITREESKRIKVDSITENVEYHICDRNNGEQIIVNGNAFFIIKRKDRIEVCAVEDILPRYWGHDYISAKLWFRSYEKAINSNKNFYSVFKDIDPHKLYSILFMFELPLGFSKLSEVVRKADEMINKTKDEAGAIARRELLKYFNL